MTKMMRTSLRKRLWVVLPLSILLSCSADNGTPAGGGVGVTVGPIAGFGSIIVNGVHMDIEHASVDLDGEPGDDTDPHRSLKEGMVVVVKGDFSSDGLTGVAHSVEFRDNLEGPVDPNGVDVPNSRLMVLGQTVIVNTETRIEDHDGTLITLADIQEGNVVEVSGLPKADGSIVATRIERKANAFDPNTMEIELKGTIANLDIQSSTFTIGGLLVDYGTAPAQIKDAPGGVLSDGLFVEVKSRTAPSGTPLTLIASEVEVKSRLCDSLGRDGDHAEIEGFVTEFSSIDQPFLVNGVSVQTTADTRYEHGTSGDVMNGVRLEVEGSLDADGVLVAMKVEFEDSGEHGEDSSDHSGDDDSDDSADDRSSTSPR